MMKIESEEITRLPSYYSWQKIDSTNQSMQYLLIDSNNNRFLQTSKNAYLLYKLVQEGYSFEEIAQRLPETTSSADVHSAYHKFISKVLDTESSQKDPAYFWLKIPFASQSLVANLAQPLSNLYHPITAGTSLTIAIMVFIIAFWIDNEFITRPFIDGSFLWGYIFFLFSLLFHELGHSAASSYFGVRPNKIGFALYLIYPVFYSDVSGAWMLKRLQRAIVDFGGMYFQILAGGCFCLIYLLFNIEAARIGIVLIIINCLFSLNPIFKFDGYWILADTLGVTNLGDQPALIVKHLLRNAFQKSSTQLPWPKLTIVFLSVYALISIIAWGGFLFLLWPNFWAYLHTLPELSLLIATGFPKSITIENVSTLLISASLILVTLMITFKITKNIFDLIVGVFVD